jgi:hypothetical protein
VQLKFRAQIFEKSLDGIKAESPPEGGPGWPPAGQTRSASRRSKIDFSAAQIFERANVGLGQDVQLSDRETQKIMNPVLQVPASFARS